MKLYATTTSERPSRPARKGGDKWVAIDFFYKNQHVATISLQEKNTLRPLLMVQVKEKVEIDYTKK